MCLAGLVLENLLAASAHDATHAELVECAETTSLHLCGFVDGNNCVDALLQSPRGHVCGPMLALQAVLRTQGKVRFLVLLLPDAVNKALLFHAPLDLGWPLIMLDLRHELH